MASKDKEEQTQESTQEATESPVEATVTSEEPIRLHNGVTYLERKWKEIPMYQCPACSYNNVGLEDFARYQAFTCKRPECPIPVPTGIQQQVSHVVDRFGNPVIVTTERT